MHKEFLGFLETLAPRGELLRCPNTDAKLVNSKLLTNKIKAGFK